MRKVIARELVARQLSFATLLFSTVAHSAPPEVKHLFPPAGQRGTNVTVSIGKTDTWPSMSADAPGIKFTPTPMMGIYNVEIPADVVPGPHLVRAYNAEGPSAPRFFIVTETPELRAKEPNDLPAEAQAIENLPASISGRLDKTGDVDGFAVTLKKGQTLVTWVESHVLASTMDPLLRVTDRSGRVLGFNHDARTLDPFLAWEAPRDGTFVVQVMGFAYPAQASVQLIGGEGCLYRLHLSTGPIVRYAAPLSVKAGTKAPLHLIGWNLTQTEVECDATQATPGAEIPPPNGIAESWLEPVRASDRAELTEREPRAGNDPEDLPLGAAVTGRIRAPREEDRYKFTAQKGKPYEIALTAAKIGSPLDAWLRVEGSDGKELGKNDDASSRDPRLTWNAPADGNFTIVVGDLTHRGGDDFLYRLTVNEAAPAISGTVVAHAFAVGAGKTTEIKANVKRVHGYKVATELAAKNLPAGVTAAPVDLPEKDGEITLKLVADDTAVAANQPFQIVLREKETRRELPVVYAMASTSEDNGVPQGYAELVINSTEHLWLTVTPKPPTPPSP